MQQSRKGLTGRLVWAFHGKIDLLMGAEVKHCSVADGSDSSPTGQLPGMNVCECVCVCVNQGLTREAVYRKG